MNKIILMVGISGSGKSTRAKEISDKTGALIINRDKLREMLFGYTESNIADYYKLPDLYLKENQITSFQDYLIERALIKGDDVIIDNKSVGPVTSYTFNRITHNHEISASFAVNTYTVSVEGNSGGSVNPSGNTVVNYGTDLSCSFAPDYGFRISDIKVNNVSQGPVSSFKLSNITADQNISVTFSPIPAYEISAAAGEGGSITPSGF